MTEMQGRRLSDGAHPYAEVEPGDYWVPETPNLGKLWFRDPLGSLGRITTHAVEFHEDGTATVKPSVAPRPEDPPGAFHGFLTRGVWTW